MSPIGRELHCPRRTTRTTAPEKVGARVEASLRAKDEAKDEENHTKAARRRMTVPTGLEHRDARTVGAANHDKVAAGIVTAATTATRADAV